jgi:arginase
LSIAAGKRVRIIGVPMDLGANRRGVDMGPSAIRYAGLHAALEPLGYEVHDQGNLRVADRAEGITSIDEICRVALELATLVEGAVRAGEIPLVLGGDHSIAMGTLAGLARAQRAKPGVLYLDAHADINTPDTSPSGNVHGMPLAVAAGLFADPFPQELRGSVEGSSVALIATRSVDEQEKGNIGAVGATAITMAEIDRVGMAAAMERAIAVALAGRGIHLSIDMDAIDPNEAPGVGTPVPGGLTYREAQLAMEMIAASGRLVSVEVAEVNPILDQGNKTARLAVELIASALGKTIL